MSFKKFKTDSYCVGGRHRSATTETVGDVTSTLNIATAAATRNPKIVLPTLPETRNFYHTGYTWENSYNLCHIN